MLYAGAMANSKQFDSVSPVRWVFVDKYSLQEVNLRVNSINYQNPCAPIILNDMEVPNPNNYHVRKSMERDCIAYFNEKFVDPLKKFCQPIKLNRPRRSLLLDTTLKTVEQVVTNISPLATPIFRVADVVSNYVSRYFLPKASGRLKSINEVYDESKKQMKSIRENISHRSGEEKTARIREGVLDEIVSIRHSQEQYQINQFNSTWNQVNLNNLMLKIDHIRHEWIQNRISHHLFDILGLERVCPTVASCTSSRPINCLIDEDREEVTFQYIAPIFNPNVQLIKAFPIPYVKKMLGGEYCFVDYIGEKLMFYDKLYGCATPATSIDEVQDTFVVENNCHRRLKSVERSNWRLGTCVTQVEDALKLAPVTVEYESDETIVYCYLRNITIGGKEENCPSHPFSLNKDIVFTISNINYRNRMIPGSSSTNSINIALEPVPVEEEMKEEFDRRGGGKIITIIEFIGFSITLCLVAVLFFLNHRRSKDTREAIVDTLADMRRVTHENRK